MKNIILVFALALTAIACKPYSDKDKAAFEEKIEAFEKKQALSLEKSSSGLHYKIYGTTSERIIKANDQIRVTYEGKLLDGSSFDKQENPIELNVRELIPAWREVLAEMSVGDSCYLIAPPYIAYGQKGKGEIPGNAILQFTIKVHEAY